MMEFQEKRKLKSFMYSRVTILLLIVVIVWLAGSVWSVYKKQDMTKDNLSKVAASLEALQVRERMLSSEIEKLKTESGVEQEIREKYNLVKEGEEVIVVVNKEADSDSQLGSTQIGFWQKVLDWLK